MTKSIALLVLCALSFTACHTSKNKFIFKVVEQMPEFPGGEQAMYQYIAASVRYPDSATYFGKEATVRVKFMIDEYGSIDSVSTVQQFGYGLNREAERVVKNMPPWKPAMNNGLPVKVYFQIPIKFVLADDTLKQQAK